MVKSITKVMRLYPSEENLIKYIRQIGDQNIVSELRAAYMAATSVNDLQKLKNVISILEGEISSDMDILISSGFISSEDADYLIDCVQQNKNIIITGGVGSGKTTLLNALLQYQDEPVNITQF